MPGSPWWRDAVVYEIYVRSFADSDGDGLGDLAGIRSRLAYLADLGVDALWLTPFYPSPMADGGYDVADPRAVDVRFGDLGGFDRLRAEARGLGLRLMVDVVPNHTSVVRPWFVAALRDGPGSPARERYLFRDGRGSGGVAPPNNWPSTFGGSAWTRVADGQWYLHLFAPEQPDLNWRHPDVGADAVRTLRFWLDRGVDGVRIDVAHGLVKAAGLPDLPGGVEVDLLAEHLSDTPMWNQPEVHDIYRRWHQVLASYPDDRMAVGEVWLGDPRQVACYVRPDELSQAFNFRLLKAPWSATELRRRIDASLSALADVGASATWVLANHDVIRTVTRYGDGAVGLRRARAAVLLLLALPGAAYLYQGEELGLPEVDLPDEALRDPVWERSGHRDRGRDGCRVPLPWSGDRPPFGFSSADVQPWLPMPRGWAELTVDAQLADQASTLSLYRRALAVRRREPALRGGALTWLARSADTVAFRRTGREPASGELICVVNLGAAAVPLPAGEVMVASEPAVGQELPPDTAAWVRPAAAPPD